MHFTFDEQSTLCGQSVSSVTMGRINCRRCVYLWSDKLVETIFQGDIVYPLVCTATTDGGT